LRTLLRRMAETIPIVVSIEDLQWADSDSLTLLRSLLRAPAPCGVLMVITIRTQDEDERYGDSQAELFSLLRQQDILRRVFVGPLASYEQRELMLKLGSQGAAFTDLNKTIWQDVAGHPMLLAELARYAQEAPDQLRQASSFSLRDVIWRRVEVLSPRPRQLLRLIAVAGEPLPLRVLADVLELPDTDRERAWSVLRISRLARRVTRIDRQLWIGAYHDKVRESIIEHLEPHELTDLHRRLALALEEWGAASAASLAHHWLAAGDRYRGARYMVEAARQAAEQLALDRAAELYRAALAELPASDRDGEADRELDTLRCQSWIGLVETLRITDIVDEADTLLDQAQAVADRHSLYLERATIHVLRGNLIFPTGNAQACLVQHEQARVFAKKAGSLKHEVQALGGMGDAYLASARMLSACEHYDVCVELCREYEFVGIELAYLPMRGWTRFYRNELDDAVGDCREAAERAARIGDKWVEVMARIWLGMIVTEMGELDDAEQHLRTAAGIAQKIGMRRLEPLATAMMARVLTTRGQRAEAEVILEEALARCHERDLVFAGPIQLGALAYATENPAVFSRALDRGDELLRGKPPGYNYLCFYRDVIDAAFRFGDAERLSYYVRRLERFTSVEPTPWSRFFITWGNALSAHLQSPGDVHLLSALRQVSDRAHALGLRGAADVATRALVTAASGPRGMANHLSSHDKR
ncbi:MAG: hypothetical protein AAGC55_14120, partial [Myxococcota bacterium]